MAAPKYDRSVMRLRQFNSALAKRIGLLKNFPVRSEVRWKYGDGTPEVVTKHDEEKGRVLTAKGNYDPGEL